MLMTLFGLYEILAVVYLIIGLFVITKDKQMVNILFFVMTIILSLTASINGWFVIGEAYYDTEFAYRVLIVLNAAFYYILTFFTANLTGNRTMVDSFRKRLFFNIPFFIAILTYSVVSYGPEDFVEAVIGKNMFSGDNRGYFYNTYYYLYVAMAGGINTAFIFRWYRTTKIAREKKQALIVLISVFFGFLVGFTFDKFLPLYSETHIDPFLTIVAIIPFLTVGYAIRKYNMMNLNPKNIATEIFDTMSEAMIVVDYHLNINYYNDGVVNLLGWNKTQLLGKHISKLFGCDISQMNLKDISSEEIELISSSGHTISLLCSANPSFDVCGEMISIVLIFQDLTEIREMHNKVLNMNDKLEKRVIERTRDLNETNYKLVKEIDKRRLAQEDIAFVANHDYLTGLFNRRYISNTFNGMIDVVEKHAFVYMDLDNFKGINDTLGHIMGDAVLMEVSERLSQLIKEPNKLARIGGDEFLILIEDRSRVEEVEELLTQIVDSFNEPFDLINEERHITASLGVAFFPEDGKDFMTLMKNADIALYAAKQLGKGKYVLCDDKLKVGVEEEYRIMNDLETAVEAGEIVNYYQPKVDSSTNRITGFEALVRWQNGSDGLISPGKFIPIAEKTGAICGIGEQVLRNACIQMKEFVDAGHHDLLMSVNISVVQLEKDEFVSGIKDMLEETGLDAVYLELEITESLLLNNDKKMINKLLALKELGLKISMDDFGTEYSSLKYMKYLPIDKVKIDREFVSQININYKDEEIIKSTIKLIQVLGFDVIAEGVETEEQVEFLSDHGCNEIQGFYYHKPMAAEALEALVKEEGYAIMNV